MMRKMSFSRNERKLHPSTLRVFTPLHESSRGEGLPEHRVAARDLVQVGGLLMRESSALCLDEGGHGHNTGCIQSAYAPSVVR